MSEPIDLVGLVCNVVAAVGWALALQMAAGLAFVWLAGGW